MKHIHKSHELQDVLGDGEDGDGRCACVRHITGCMLNNHLAIKQLQHEGKWGDAVKLTLDYEHMKDHLLRDDDLFSHRLGIGHC